MDPERPIEKLLRAAAEKRRGAVGERLGLHPANRALLEGEVRRKFGPAPRVQPRSWWPTLGWAFGIFMVVGIVLWMARQPEKSQYAQTASAPTARTEPPADALAGSASARGGAKAEADDLKVAVQTNLGFARSAPPASAAPVRATETLASTPAKPAAAPVPTATTAAPAPRATFRREPGQKASASDLMPQPVSGSGGARGGAAGELKATLAESSTATAAPPSEDRAFAKSRAVADKATGPMNTTGAAGLSGVSAGVPILTRFSVEQSGQKLRIVDQDGSVYSGQISNPAATALQSKELARSDAVTFGEANRTARRLAPAPEPTSTYFFEVMGTNRTSLLPVFFSGNYLAGRLSGSNQVFTNLLGSGTNLWPPTNAAAMQPAIRGKAVIGNEGREMPVQAFPR